MKSALAPCSGLPTVAFVSAGIGVDSSLPSSVNSNSRSSGHEMPVSSFENAMPAGTPVNSSAVYSLTNTLPVTVAVATRSPCLLSVTVTVTSATCVSYETPGISPFVSRTL